MGNVIPDRLFWAQSEGDDDDGDTPTPNDPAGFDLPAHDTKH